MENNNGAELVIVPSEQASTDNEPLPLTVDSVLSMAGLELTHERYVTEDGQIVNPGIAKSVWDEALERSGIDPKKMIEYNID